jgi:hypothetical protein
MSGTVTWEVAIFMIGTLLAGIGLAFSAWRYVVSYVEKQQIPVKQDIEELKKRHHAFREDFTGEKLRTANEYVSVSHLREVEGRFMTAVEKIDQKLDRLLSGRSRSRSAD